MAGVFPEHILQSIMTTELIDAFEYGYTEEIETILTNQSMNYDAVFHWAAISGNEHAICRLLEEPRFDPSFMNNRAITDAAMGYHDIVCDLLLTDRRVYSTIHKSNANLTQIRMICSRASEVCMAMQDLNLPALLTLMILDELIPNKITMWAKWKLITTIKHFHDQDD